MKNQKKNMISVFGAREHNLNDITVHIPRNKLVVITGLSGSGKSTVANATEKILHNMGLQTYILDGDNCKNVSL